MDFYRAALQINPDLESAQSQLQAVETKVELLALRVGAAQNGSSLLSVDCKSGHCCLFFFCMIFCTVLLSLNVAIGGILCGKINGFHLFGDWVWCLYYLFCSILSRLLGWWWRLLLPKLRKRRNPNVPRRCINSDS